MTEYVERAPEEQLRPGQLLDVVINTSLDARYVLPDVDGRQGLDLVRRFEKVFSQTQLTLVNASGACLTMPTRLIDRIAVHLDSESTRPLLEWRRPK